MSSGDVGMGMLVCMPNMTRPCHLRRKEWKEQMIRVRWSHDVSLARAYHKSLERVLCYPSPLLCLDLTMFEAPVQYSPLPGRLPAPSPNSDSPPFFPSPSPESSAFVWSSVHSAGPCCSLSYVCSVLQRPHGTARPVST